MSGLYFHIPFCIKKCYYCDFTSFSCIEQQDEYTLGLIKEIELKKEILKQREWSTVFFGGGTPSLLSIDNLKKVMSKLGLYTDLRKIKEFTIEVNPKTVTSEKLEKYIDLGINRLSIGIQSFNVKELKAIGRIHTAEDAIKTIELAKESGFSNISLDLIYGLPFQDIKSLKANIDTACNLGINHISFYGLQVEEGTPLEKMIQSGEVTVPTEDESISMYLESVELLRDYGLNQYEVSNFALDGQISLHNYNYWMYHDYLSFGVSSHSKIGNRRFANTEEMDEYLYKLNHNIAAENYEEYLTDEEMAFERKMLLLRTHIGLPLSNIENHKYLECLINDGLGTIEQGRFRLTVRGYLMSNEIINNLN